MLFETILPIEFANWSWLFQEFYMSHGYITYTFINWSKIISKKKYFIDGVVSKSIEKNADIF